MVEEGLGGNRVTPEVLDSLAVDLEWSAEVCTRH